MTDYTEAAVQRLLSEDGHIADQGIEASVREDVLVLRGEVESPVRRDEIVRRVAEEFPALRVHSDIGVVRSAAPTEPEELR